MFDIFGAPDLRQLMLSYAHALSAHENDINQLNVFPVADADTGSNMRGTMDGVAAAIEDFSGDMPELAKQIRHSALMSARGNSGIILSQWLRGFTGHLADTGPASPDDLEVALKQASDSAYSAVEEPKEGTILTIARVAAEHVDRLSATSIEAVWVAAADGGNDALNSTPDHLEVLREHGVVDSGGYGLAVLFNTASGDPITRMHCHSAVAQKAQANGVSGWFEVTFLLDSEDVAPLRERWGELGDSIDISGGDEGDPFSCHIHTGDIGAAIEAGIDVGHPYRIQVEALPPENRARG